MGTASLSVVRSALKQRYGGQIVEEVATIPCVNERQECYRWSDGWVVEWVGHGAYVTPLGDPSSTFLIDAEYIARVGEEWPDSFALESQTANDNRRRNETSDRTETLTPQEVETAVTGAIPLSRFMTTPVVKKPSLTPTIDRIFDEYFAVVTP